MDDTRDGRADGGVRSWVMYALSALVISAGAWALGVWEGRQARARALETAENRALEVARTTAAAINVGMENAVVQLSTVVGSTGLADLPAEEGSQRACEQRLGALTAQGFSFLLVDRAGQVVCQVGEGP